MARITMLDEYRTNLLFKKGDAIVSSQMVQEASAEPRTRRKKVRKVDRSHGCLEEWGEIETQMSTFAAIANYAVTCCKSLSKNVHEYMPVNIR